MTAADPLALSVMFPSEFLKAEDFQGRTVEVTIESIRGKEMVPMAGGKKEPCNVVRMKGKKKKWILNKTNGNALALLLSSATAPTLADAVGKRVLLVADVDTKSGEDLLTIRIAGSPDAAPDRIAAYERAWRGERKGGKLCARLKRARALLAVSRVEETRPPEQEPEMSTEPMEEPADPALDDFGAELDERESDTNGGGA